MASARMPDEFFEAVAHHVPPEKPVGPEGGRPRAVIRVPWFVLATGSRWEGVPEELGCSGRTAHRRLRAWEEAGILDRHHADLLTASKRAGNLDLDTVIIDGVTVRAFGGGVSTGPSPVDRRKLGSKHIVMVDKAKYPWASAQSGRTPATTSRSCRCLWPTPNSEGRRAGPRSCPPMT